MLPAHAEPFEVSKAGWHAHLDTLNANSSAAQLLQLNSGSQLAAAVLLLLLSPSSHQRARSAIVSTAEVQTETTQTIQYDSHKPHGDASETGSAVVLEHPSDQRKATVVRNIVFITSEVGAALVGRQAGWEPGLAAS